MEFSSGIYVAVGDIVLVELHAVEVSRLDVDVLRAVVLREDSEFITVFKGDCHFTEYRASDYVFVCPRFPEDPILIIETLSYRIYYICIKNISEMIKSVLAAMLLLGISQPWTLKEKNFRALFNIPPITIPDGTPVILEAETLCPASVRGARAEWIGAGEDACPDSAVTAPAPYLRKEFSVDRGVRKATAYICGLGFYEFYINGEKVGDQVLAPAVTNYDRRRLDNILYHFDDRSDKRVLYNMFDVTSMLRKGGNAAGVILGNGWYNQRDRTVEGKMWYDTPRMICRIDIEYEDGSSAMVVSDGSWKVSEGPMLHDGIFTGEVYDARRELTGWDIPGYDDSGWRQAAAVRAPEGELCLQTAPYDRVTGVMKPDSFVKENDTTFMYSFPEMISGWVKLRVKGNAGDRVSLRFIGEEQEDYGQKDVYILRGGRTETWAPRFTWHTFRYVEVTSSGVGMEPGSIVAEIVHTDVPQAGAFVCSNDLFNRINKAYLRTQTNNFHGSISSDCPHRERLAYTGDAQVETESSIYSFDMRSFYRKWFDDMADAQNSESGFVPHTAPFGGGGGGPAWGSAYVIMPWLYYCYYGDTGILAEHYEGMKHWVQYLGTRTDARGIVVREEPGGWCLGDWCTPQDIEIPPELVNTAYYYRVADLMSRIASVLGNDEDAVHFTALCRKIKDDFNTVFFDPEACRYWEGRQGSDVFPLAFGMVPEGLEDEVLGSLLRHLEETGYHFDTGILATPLMLEVLSSSGHGDAAFRLMDQRSGVGFGYLLDSKNTCLWERWNGWESHCHPMFGSVVAWFYRHVAGIRYDESAPGMRHIIIAPQPVGDLTECSCSYGTAQGTVSSEWKVKDGVFRLDVSVPEGAEATVIMPDGQEYNIGEGKKTFKTIMS